MSMDELKFTYTPLGLPNIVMEEARNNEPKPTTIHPTIAGLMKRLAKAKPKWTFVGIRRDINLHATRFTVYENREVLGTVWRDYNYNTSSEGIAFDNTRLRAVRQRGDATRTKDMNRAFKVITKTFGAKTTSELLTEGIKEAAEAAMTVANTVERQLMVARHRLMDKAMEFAQANWEAFENFALGEGVQRAMLDQLPEAEAAFKDAKPLAAAIHLKNGITVVLRGNEYITNQAGEAKVLAQDQLSPHLKRCVGMLKLAEDKQFIPGMGVRVNATTFYVIPPEEGTNDQAD